jgi:hypothetical protein
MQTQLLFYRERILTLEKKVKDLKIETLNQLKNISHKENEISDKDVEIFQLKLVL